ncbi:Methionine synthase II (cobalamin-independent) [Burkholderia dolosa AU0158]|nr:Methionine synthase II (cobalamin-independent) [Burkholderia dolosa AU0158]
MKSLSWLPTLHHLDGSFNGHDTQPRLSAHRRETRTQVRSRTLLERRVVARRADRARRGAAPAPLERPARSRLRAARRFLVLRPRARHELHARQPAEARAGLSRRCARQLFPRRARPFRAVGRTACGMLRRRRGRRNDEVVRYELSLHRPGVSCGHELLAGSVAAAAAADGRERRARAREAGDSRADYLSVARQGKGRFRSARAVAEAAARVRRAARHADRSGCRVGADRRTGAGHRTRRRVARRAAHRVCGAGDASHQAAARDVLRPASGQPDARVLAAGGRSAYRCDPCARRNRRAAARVAGRSRAVGRRDQRPQHLEDRSERDARLARAAREAARRASVDRAVVLAAARAGRSRERNAARSRDSFVARVRAAEARRAEGARDRAERRARCGRGRARRERRGDRIAATLAARAQPGGEGRSRAHRRAARQPDERVCAARGKAGGATEPARVSDDDDRLVPADRRDSPRAQRVQGGRAGRSGLPRRDAGRDRAQRARTGGAGTGRARARRSRAQRHGRILRRTARRLRVQPVRLGAVVRVALREAADPVRRHQSSARDDGRVDRVCAVADEQADEGDADRPGDDPELVVRARRSAALGVVPATRARDPRRGARSREGGCTRDPDRRGRVARRLAAAPLRMGRVSEVGGRVVPDRRERRARRHADPHAHVLFGVQRHHRVDRRHGCGRDHDRDVALRHGAARRVRRLPVSERDRARRL